MGMGIGHKRVISRTQPGSLCSKLIRSAGLGRDRKCAGLLIEHKLSSLGIPEDKRSCRDL